MIGELPEEGELVIATVTRITPYGAYVKLDEYGGLEAFLHISEVSTGWVRNIERFVKKDRKAVFKVIRVDPRRMEVDVSLKQVSGEERRRKIAEVKRGRRAKAILTSVAQDLRMGEEELARYMREMERRFGTIYECLERIAIKGERAIEGLDLPERFVKRLVEVVKERIKPPMVEITGVMELSVKGSEGIEVIKDALRSVKGRSGKGGIELKYLGAPKYRLIVTSHDFKSAERLLASTIERVRHAIEERGGTFGFTREGSRRVS